MSLLHFMSHEGYEAAMARVAEERDEMLERVFAHWISCERSRKPKKEVLMMLGETAHDSGLSFDEVLYYYQGYCPKRKD